MNVSTPPPVATTLGPKLSVQTSGLRKTYRSVPAVNSLNLEVPAAGVHGFLGPNGSGKTTTIRMLLGLIKADSGSMRIFDQPVPDDLAQVMNRVGAIVEQPKFFPNFSGRKNLRILGQAIGAPSTKVDEVLEEVGLAGRGKDAFRTYSLGMKQRLAIAATLLKDPDLLIFDEPTNGLDPAGIHEIRATMRGLADAGKAVLVSSHILNEVQQVADTVTIIGRGRLLAQGPVSEILSGSKEQVVLRTRNRDGAKAALVEAGYTVADQPDQSLLVSAEARLDPEHINQTLGRQDIWAGEIRLQRMDLEAVFLELTANEHLGQAQHGPRHAADKGAA